jgi:hypothetical protein
MRRFAAVIQSGLRIFPPVHHSLLLWGQVLQI